MTKIQWAYKNNEYAEQPLHRFQNDGGKDWLDCSIGGKRLFLEIDEKGLISKARFEVENEEETGLMEALCGLVEETPIQEAAEHGAQRLELVLRENVFNRNVPGISLPSNFPQPFAQIDQILKQLFRNFLKKSGKNPGVNFFPGKGSQDWVNISNDEKQKKITDIFSSAGENSAMVKSISGNRVVIEFVNESDNGDQGARLLRIESQLKEKLDRGIELFLEEARDRSSIRRL